MIAIKWPRKYRSIDRGGDKRVAEFDYKPMICSIVYKYCTRTISKHLYSGIFKDSLDTKYKMLCFMFKIGVFLKKL